jgi:hypothetical protein
MYDTQEESLFCEEESRQVTSAGTKVLSGQPCLRIFDALCGNPRSLFTLTGLSTLRLLCNLRVVCSCQGLSQRIDDILSATHEVYRHVSGCRIQQRDLYKLLFRKTAVYFKKEVLRTLPGARGPLSVETQSDDAGLEKRTRRSTQSAAARRRKRLGQRRNFRSQSCDDFEVQGSQDLRTLP